MMEIKRINSINELHYYTDNFTPKHPLITTIELDKEYEKLAKAAKLIEIFKKFNKELPRKNYWEKITLEVVTR